MAEGKAAAGLRLLLKGLVTYVVDFTINGPDSDADDVLHDREPASLDTANVVSSRIIGTDKHMLVIDIDQPSWLVKSSTADHFHLYVKVPEGIPTEPYMRLLDALAECRVIEEGYARVSKKRGFTSVRLPWVKKTPEDIPTAVFDPARLPNPPNWAQSMNGAIQNGVQTSVRELTAQYQAESPEMDAVSRQMAKDALFRAIYGGGPGKIADMLPKVTVPRGGIQFGGVEERHDEAKVEMDRRYRDELDRSLRNAPKRKDVF